MLRAGSKSCLVICFQIPPQLLEWGDSMHLDLEASPTVFHGGYFTLRKLCIEFQPYRPVLFKSTRRECKNDPWPLPLSFLSDGPSIIVVVSSCLLFTGLFKWTGRGHAGSIPSMLHATCLSQLRCLFSKERISPLPRFGAFLAGRLPQSDISLGFTAVKLWHSHFKKKDISDHQIFSHMISDNSETPNQGTPPIWYQHWPLSFLYNQSYMMMLV